MMADRRADGWRAAWLAAALCAGGAGAAPVVTFDVQPRAVSLGEPVVAAFTVAGVNDPPAPVLPDMEGVRVESGLSRSLQTQVVGNRVSTSTTFRYRLLPLQEGTLAIGPVDYVLEGETHTLPAVEIQVAPRPREGGTSQTGLQGRLFATLTTDRPAYYMQEAFTVTLSIYSSNLRIGSGISLDGLPGSGLAFQDFQELGAGREVVSNRVFDVQRYTAQVRGVTAGVFKVQPALRIPIRVQRQSDRFQSPFDRLFSSMTEQVEPVTVLPALLTIEIKPLPEDGRPASYSGAVGRFTFQAQVQPRSLQAGDPVTLTMQIQGEGNMDAVSAPTLEIGEDFKAYDTRLVSKRMNEGRSRGEKTFEKVLIPRSEQVAGIPRIAFSYFDPEAGAYRTLEQGPFPLEVAANTGAVARVLQAGPNGERPPPELAVIRDDIRYLHRAPPRWVIRRGPPWYGRPWTRRAQLVPPVVALLVMLAARHRRALAADPVLSRRRRAPKVAAARLQAARKARQAADRRGFYEAVWNALTRYFGDRLNLAPGEVSADRVAARFSEAGLRTDQVESIREVFARCEHARFGDALVQAQPMIDDELAGADRLLERVEAAIRACERTPL